MKLGLAHAGSPRSGVRRYGKLLAAAARRCRELEVHEVDLGWPLGRASRRSRLARAADHLRSVEVVHLQHARRTWGGSGHLQRLCYLAATCSRPLVLTLHDVALGRAADFRPPREARLGWWDAARLMRQQLLAVSGAGRRAARIAHRLAAIGELLVVHTEAEAMALRKVLGRRAARLRVVPHLVEDRGALPDAGRARRELGLAENRVVTLLGFLHPRKGCGLLVAALRHLPADVVAVFAGGAPDGGQAYVERLLALARRLGVAARVRVTGYLTEAELEACLAATHVAACPFEAISASGSLSTWIAAARPIVVSDLPALDDYEKLQSGSLRRFRPYTPEALAAALGERLTADSSAQVEALVRLRRQLTMDRVLGRYLDCYRELV